MIRLSASAVRASERNVDSHRHHPGLRISASVIHSVRGFRRTGKFRVETGKFRERQQVASRHIYPEPVDFGLPRPFSRESVAQSDVFQFQVRAVLYEIVRIGSIVLIGVLNYGIAVFRIHRGHSRTVRKAVAEEKRGIENIGRRIRTLDQALRIGPGKIHDVVSRHSRKVGGQVYPLVTEGNIEAVLDFRPGIPDECTVIVVDGTVSVPVNGWPPPP